MEEGEVKAADNHPQRSGVHPIEVVVEEKGHSAHNACRRANHTPRQESEHLKQKPAPGVTRVVPCAKATAVRTMYGVMPALVQNKMPSAAAKGAVVSSWCQRTTHHGNLSRRVSSNAAPAEATR